MTSPGRDEFLRRLRHQIAADIDGREKRLAPGCLQARIQLQFLQPGAAAESREHDFSRREPIDGPRERLPIHPGKLGVSLDRGMSEKDLPPQLRLPRCDIEKLRGDPVGLQRLNRFPFQRLLPDRRMKINCQRLQREKFTRLSCASKHLFLVLRPVLGHIALLP